MKEPNPKVSIVIPVYNGSNFLGEAIDSALAQTYKNVEIVVVNDGSTDKGATEKVAKSYGDKVRYFYKRNGGVASALNFGIEKMMGSYFSWLSHDDLYETTKIEDQINLLTSYPDGNTIITCNVRTLFASGIKKRESIDKKTFKYFDIFLATAADVGLNGCTLLIPKKALVESGGFDTSLLVTQDYDLWFRLSRLYKYKFVLLEKNLVFYRRHDEQDSVKKQQLTIKAGDDLHYDILNTIDYKRFEEYFSDDRSNVMHTRQNYELYKLRGYKKTASMMLKNILRYYYDNDRDKFYKVYRSEIQTDTRNNKSILLEYKKLLASGTNAYPLKESSIARQSLPPKTRVGRIARRLHQSIRQDGVYLTSEKIVRKVHSRVTKSRK